MLFFGVWPYLALAVCVTALVWRWRHDQLGWTSRTSQLLERRWLAWGSPLFHYGALLAILGHAVGLLVPESWTQAWGVSEHAYHVFAVGGGVLAGLLVTVGLVILLARRVVFRHRLRMVTNRWDLVVLPLLAVVVLLGMSVTFGTQVLGGGYDYRATVSLWLRSLFTGNPDVALMASAPLVYRVHVVAAFLLFALWPMTRLVHVFSVPLGYLARPYVVYRSRAVAGR